MSTEEKNDNENENGQDEGSMNIYDDNAYMFGDEPSGNNSEEQNEIQDYNDNENQINQQNVEKDEVENENDEINNMESKELSYVKYYEKEKQKNKLINSEDNEELINNQNNNKDNNKMPQKMIVRINNNNLKNMQSNIGDNNNINNMGISSIKNEQKISDKLNDINNIEDNKMNNQKEEYEENEGGEEVEEEGENGEMEGEMDEEVENEGEEEENIPLVTLKFISICQYCKNSFNSNIHLPYLLKCGHFFCLKCIKEHFTDEEGIKCPNDGLVALSIKELKILNNLITDKNITSQRDKKENQIDNDINGIDNNNKLNENNMCKIHKGQKLTHIITDTKQLVCVYCAFDLVRKNPKCEVKEIKEKFDEFVNEADKVININQNNIKIIQESLKDIKKNKEIEEKNINTYFEHIFKYLTSKKAEYLSQIDSIFTDNAKKLSKKLEIFSEQIEQGESLKGLIDNYEQNNNFDEILENYIKLQSIKSNEQDNQINLQEYKFSHDDETKIMKYINNFGDIKTVNKYIPFQNGKKDAFKLKVSPNQESDSIDESKKNYYNFNSNPVLISNNNNNKNSSRFNNSMENQEIINELNYNNNNIANKKTYYSNYNFNFNKINPIANNNSKRNNISSNKPILNNNNIFRNSSSNTEVNNGNINYINLDVDNNNRDKNYSFNINKNIRGNNNRILSIQENNLINHKLNINNGDGRIYNNFYNINYSKRLEKEKDNSNQNMSNHNKNIKNSYETQGYEYKGFKTFNFNK